MGEFREQAIADIHARGVLSDEDVARKRESEPKPEDQWGGRGVVPLTVPAFSPWRPVQDTRDRPHCYAALGCERPALGLRRRPTM